jgi:ribosomal protein S18 acetylase RimI-like enzyme
MLAISVMTETDISFATGLTTGEEWGYLEEDFRRLMYFEPQGCFVAWKSDKRVGVITTTTYEDYAFLGSLIVKKEERGRGIGKSLMKHAMNYLLGKGVKTLELDGDFLAVPWYRRLGFRDKYLSLRFKGEARGYGNAGLSYSPEMAEKIVHFDREKTGLSRERIIGKLLEEFGDSAHVIKRRRVAAYAIVRPRAGGELTVGPMVAENERVAELVFHSVIGKHSGKILYVGVPGTNRDAVRILLNAGFEYLEPSLRMYRGERKNYEGSIYAITSPEKG